MSLTIGFVGIEGDTGLIHARKPKPPPNHAPKSAQNLPSVGKAVVKTPDPMTTKEIPIDQIKPFISRARAKAGFEAMKASISAEGLKMPIQVRDLGRKDGDGIRYVLIAGEGRTTAARELGWDKITALIVDAPEQETVGRFLAENMIRRNIPWQEKGRLIRDEMKTGRTLEEIAHSYHIDPHHAAKLLRVVNKIGDEVEADGLTMNEAEVLTTLPAAGQKIVMEVARESQQSIQVVVRKARTLQKGGEGWTKAALQKALRSVDEGLAKLRTTLKRLRLHHAIGPVNVSVLLRDRGFRKLAEAAKLNVRTFEEIAK